MEVELKRLEDLSEDIVKDFSIMRKREEEMRNTNGISSFLLKKFGLIFWGFRIDQHASAWI